MQPLIPKKSLTKYSLIRDVTCLFGSHLNMHQRKGQMKRKGEKTFFVTVPLQKERLMFIFRLGLEDYSGGHGLQSTNTRRLNL